MLRRALHLCSFLPWVVALLYGGLAAHATEASSGEERAGERSVVRGVDDSSPSAVRERTQGSWPADGGQARTMSGRGAAAEAVAAAFLERKGLKILVRNYRCRLGEIDLIARDGATTVFVEVRQRASSAF